MCDSRRLGPPQRKKLAAHVSEILIFETAMTNPSSDTRDDKRAFRWVLGVVTAIVAAVLVYNVLAPKGRLHAPAENASSFTQGSS